MEAIYSISGIFFIIGLGWVLKKWFIEESVWDGIEKLTYYIFLPCLFFQKIVSIPSLANLKMELIIMVGVYLGITALLFPLRLFIDHGSFTTVIQGSIRFNSYIALSVATIFGPTALSQVIVYMAVLIPLVNLLVIGCFAFEPTVSVKTFNSNKLTSNILTSKKIKKLKKMLISILKNPLIISCWLGIIVNLLGWSLPSPLAWLEQTVNLLTKPALTLGLLSVGSGIVIHSIGKQMKLIVLSCIVKFVLLPVSMYFTLHTFEVSDDKLMLLVFFSLMPTATSTYILARQLDGNTSLAANIITVETFLSLAVIPLSLVFLRGF